MKKLNQTWTLVCAILTMLTGTLCLMGAIDSLAPEGDKWLGAIAAVFSIVYMYIGIHELYKGIIQPWRINRMIKIIRPKKGNMYTVVAGPEDYKRSGKDYGKPESCPLTIVMQREFPSLKVRHTGVSYVYTIIMDNYITVAEFEPEFTFNDFERIAKGGTFTALVTIL